MSDAFSPGKSGSQLVTAKCRVLIDGFRGTLSGCVLLSGGFGAPQSIKARTVRSCLDVVANAINKVPVPPKLKVSSCYIGASKRIPLSEQIAACVIKSSEETMLSSSV